MNRYFGAKGIATWGLCAVATVIVADDPGVSVVVIISALAICSIAPNPTDSRPLLLAAGVALILRTVLFALTGHHGTNVLFVLPQVELPAFLGGLQLGGPVMREVLAAALLEGLKLTAILCALGALVAHARVHEVLRMLPAPLREAALVINIALTFAPQMARSASAIREAQRMRGIERRFADLPATVVPVLALAMEKSVNLAESMESRGYGLHAGAHHQRGDVNRMVIASLAVVAFGSLWVMGAVVPLSPVATLASMAFWMMTVRRSHGPRRPRPGPGWDRQDLTTAAVSLGCLVLVVAYSSTSGGSASPDPILVAMACGLALPLASRGVTSR